MSKRFDFGDVIEIERLTLSFNVVLIVFLDCAAPLSLSLWAWALIKKNFHKI